jgi:hypothetical protein
VTLDVGRGTGYQKLQVQIRVMADDPTLVLKLLNLISQNILIEARVTGIYQNRKHTEQYRYRGYLEGEVDVERLD